MNRRIAYQTILRREIRRFARIWPQTLLPPVITTSLYFLIFGTLIGERIGDMDGKPYMEYLVPGIILMAVISNSYNNVVSSFYSTKFQRHIEELLIAPVPNWVILSGYVSGGVARGLIVGFVVALVSGFFTQLNVHHYGVAAAVMVLTAILFSLAGFINATLANSFDDVSIIPNFVLTPLTYLGGVFYSIDLLPDFWQKISLVNPILYMVNAFRYGLIGVSDIDVVTAFLIVGLFVVVLVLTSLFLLHRGIGIKV
ncbi:MAG: ABC transporter permease [Methylococcus sp.]|jgi:ABC-2 type transport system permease protein|nr:MAG: ABC transporter permease [Methylococcus sp.]